MGNIFTDPNIARVTVSRFKKGWAVRFTECRSISKVAVPGHPPGDAASELHLDTRFDTLYPESSTFKHDTYNDGSVYDPTRSDGTICTRHGSLR